MIYRRLLRKTAKVAFALALLYLCAWGAILVISAVTVSPRLWPTERFSSKEWLEADPGDRYRLVKDLLASDFFYQMGREDVVQILGKPASQASSAKYFYIVKYRSASELTFNSVYLLEIQFNDDGRVQKARITAD